MTDTLHEYDRGVNCALKRIVRFDIVLMEENEDGTHELTWNVEVPSKRFGMEISAKNSELMVAGKRDGRCGNR